MTAGSEDAWPSEALGGIACRRRSIPRRVAFFCVKLTAGLMALTVVAVCVLLVRINAGPIALDGLGNTIARSLQDRFGHGLRFALGSTSLVQNGWGTRLSVAHLAVTAPDGQPVLTAPKAEVAVDTMALMIGKIIPKRLEVFDVTLRAVVLKNGNLAIVAMDGSRPLAELGRRSDDQEAPADLKIAGKTIADLDPSVPRERAVVMRQAAAFLRQFLDALTDPRSPIAAVDRLGISHGTLVIQDQQTSVETVYRGLDLAFDKQHGLTSFGLSAEGPDRRWSITAMAKGRPGADREFALDVHDLTVDELRLAAGSRSHGFDMDAPVALHLDIGLRPDNSLSKAAGSMALGAGYLRTEDPDFEPLFITSIGTGFHWDPDKRRILIDRAAYVEGGTHFAGAGEVLTPAHEGEPWKIDLKLTEPGLFAPDRKGQQPVVIDAGEFTGQLALDRKTFAISRMSMRPKEGGMALAGEIDWVNGLHTRLGISMDPTPIQTIERIWPSPLASEVRGWVLTHFEAGLVSDATMQIDYDDHDLKRMRADQPPADKSVSIDFKVKNGRVRYLDGVPPLEDVVGSAHISGRTSLLNVTSATSQIDGSKIMLTNGSFSVPSNNMHPIQAFVSAHLAGRVETVAKVLSTEALKPYVSLPLDPGSLHGQIEGDMRKSLLLGKAAPGPERTDVAIKASVSDFGADHLIGKENLEDATVTFAVEDGSLKASGQGRLFGGPATFQITRTGAEQPRAEIGVTLDDAARNRVGLPAIPGVTGPIAAHIDTTLNGDPSKMRAQVDVDLSKTAVALAYLGLNKPAGRPGKISFNLAAGPDRLMMDPVAIDIGPLQARGAVDLGPDNSFQSAHFPSFKVSSGDDMKLEIAKADGIYKVSIRGASIDARPFLKAITSNDGSAAEGRAQKADKGGVVALKGFDIDVKSNILTGFNKEVMSGAELRLSKRDASIRQLAVQGRFGSSSVSGSAGADGRIKIVAQDAGALVSFIDLYRHMEGGNLSASMQMGDETLTGSLEIRDFILRDEPAIRRLVATSATLSAPGQDAEAVRRIDGGAVDFKRLRVNFQRDGSHLELRDATMYGPQIGLSVDGWLDYSHDRVGMKGTFVPAFAVNNLFSQIPVFGAFLGGKSNEGLLAITFNISGQASQPNLNINPLSAIAPGFLRNIFGVIDAPTPEFSPVRGDGPTR